MFVQTSIYLQKKAKDSAYKTHSAVEQTMFVGIDVHESITLFVINHSYWFTTDVKYA